MQLEATLSHYNVSGDPVGFRLLRRLLGNNPQFCLYDGDSSGRATAEQYVADCFADAYGARVSQFAPLLLGLQCAATLRAVIGLRDAASQRLFLEQYLDAPVEETLAPICGRAVRRSEIMELGNLASLRPGVCQLVYLVLAASLQRAGYRYAVFAGTSQVERIIGKLNFAIQSVVCADPARLGEAAAGWGRYYETSPHVLYVDLQQSLPRLQKNLLAAAVLDIYADQIDTLAGALRVSRQTTLARS